MTKPQKDKVKRIIAGICRYILLKERNGGELRFNRSVFKFIGLNEATYNIIENNLKRLRI
jgi:hypothetical protein